MPVSVGVSGVEPGSCTCNQFTGMTSTQISKAGIESYRIVAWSLTLRTDRSSPFGTVEQGHPQSAGTDGCSLADGALGCALLEEKLSMVLCVQQCKQAGNQL